MLPASTVPQSGQVLVSHHCRVSSMPYSLHLNMMIRQMVSRGLVYPLRVSRLTYTAPNSVFWRYWASRWLSIQGFVLFLLNRLKNGRTVSGIRSNIGCFVILPRIGGGG